MATNTLITNYSYANLFVWNNRFNTGASVTASGSDIELLAGMLIGRVASTGRLKQSISTATDGSQDPIGVLTQDYTIPDGESLNLNYCYSGDVNANLIVFGGSPADTLTTEISLVDSATNIVKIGTIGDLLRFKGVNPIATSENTYIDNQ